MNKSHSAVTDPIGLIDLLETIVASYQDGNSRPDFSLSLYRRWAQLARKYRVRLVKGFVVVEGGNRRRPGRRPAGRFRLGAPPYLKLAEKS
jgi:hypothetical protein